MSYNKEIRNSEATILDENVETKCSFCIFLIYFAPVNSNPPYP